MDGGATFVRDDQTVYDDGTPARVRVPSVPVSDQYPDGVKYALHYGEAGADNPVIRFVNHYGPHELHLVANAYEIDFPGLVSLYEAWRAALPPAKRADW